MPAEHQSTRVIKRMLNTFFDPKHTVFVAELRSITSVINSLMLVYLNNPFNDVFLFSYVTGPRIFDEYFQNKQVYNIWNDRSKHSQVYLFHFSK